MTELKICPYCDPKYFYVYGYCRCGRKCFPPLWDPKGDVPYLNHAELVKHWNEND